MIHGIVASGLPVALFPSAITVVNGESPMADTSGWTWVMGTAGLSSGRLVLSTDTEGAWVEQTITFSAEQISYISNGDCCLDADLSFSSFSGDTDKGAIAIVFYDSSNNVVGTYGRNWDDYTDPDVIALTSALFIPSNATYFKFQMFGERVTGTELSIYVNYVRFSLVQHPTKKARYFYANIGVNDSASWTVTAGGFGVRTTYGIVDYPCLMGESNLQSSRNKVFTPNAEELAAIAAGTATFKMRSWHFTENTNTDKSRMALEARNSANTVVATLETSAATATHTFAGTFYARSAAVPTNTTNFRAVMTLDRVAGTVNDASITLISYLIEYDK